MTKRRSVNLNDIFSSRSRNDDHVLTFRETEETKTVSPIRSLKTQPNNNRIMETKETFEAKCFQVLEIFKKKEQLIVFLEQESSLLTSFFWKDLKLSKYKRYFEEYIVVKPSKKKSEDRVTIELLSRIRLKKEKDQPNFIQLALAKLQKAGYVKYIVTTISNDSFKDSGLPEQNLFEIYGNINKKGKFNILNIECGKCKIFTRETKCKKCGSTTKDYIVGDGEQLKSSIFEKVLQITSDSDHRIILDSKMLDA